MGTNEKAKQHLSLRVVRDLTLYVLLAENLEPQESKKGSRPAVRSSLLKRSELAVDSNLLILCDQIGPKLAGITTPE